MFTRQLNEAESNLLLACAADGGVRVWRNYLTRGRRDTPQALPKAHQWHSTSD
jgi:hypothetical protein